MLKDFTHIFRLQSTVIFETLLPSFASLQQCEIKILNARRLGDLQVSFLFVMLRQEQLKNGQGLERAACQMTLFRAADITVR